MTDYAYNPALSDFAEENVPVEYKGRPRIEAFYRALGAGTQLAEDWSWAVISSLQLGNAVGTSLDAIGSIVREQRGDLTDDEYRRIITAVIRARFSSGGYDDLREVWTLLLDPRSYRLDIRGTPSFQLFAVVDEIPRAAFLARARTVMDSAKALGMRGIYTIAGEGYCKFNEVADPLGTGWDGTWIERF